MSENLDWAAQESGEVSVITESFTRGWFSSEGRHRIELEDGDLLFVVQSLLGPTSAEELPVLVVDTKLDHGLIPVSSMSREKGSLAPGLGSAISTMSIELPDGEVIKVPGTIFSEVGLGGELNSHYELESGSFEDGATAASWGATNINFKTDASSGSAEFDGTVGSLSIGDPMENITLGQLTFKGNQQPTSYGVKVGDVAVEMDGLSVTSAGDAVGLVKSMSINARNALDGDILNGEAFVTAVLNEITPAGEAGFDIAITLKGANAEAFGRIQQALEDSETSQNPNSILGPVEQDLKQLFASGFTFNLERLNVTLPEGTVSSQILLDFGEEDPATFEWTTLLLSTVASVDLSISEAVVEMLLQAEPNIAMAIGSGYLVKRGDMYELDAELKKGLLTVNGAPIPLPLGGFR